MWTLSRKSPDYTQQCTKHIKTHQCPSYSAASTVQKTACFQSLCHIWHFLDSVLWLLLWYYIYSLTYMSAAQRYLCMYTPQSCLYWNTFHGELQLETLILQTEHMTAYALYRICFNMPHCLIYTCCGVLKAKAETEMWVNTVFIIYVKVGSL